MGTNFSSHPLAAPNLPQLHKQARWPVASVGPSDQLPIAAQLILSLFAGGKQTNNASGFTDPALRLLRFVPIPSLICCGQPVREAAPTSTPRRHFVWLGGVESMLSPQWPRPRGSARGGVPSQLVLAHRVGEGDRLFVRFDVFPAMRRADAGRRTMQEISAGWSPPMPDPRRPIVRAAQCYRAPARDSGRDGGQTALHRTAPPARPSSAWREAARRTVATA